MKIIGIGVDIVDVDEMRKIFQSDRTLARIFSDSELESLKNDNNTIQRLAGWFALKEAVIKSLNTPKEVGLVLQDIVISHGINGEPICTFQGKIKELFDENKAIELKVSLSHSEKSAVGMAVCIGE